MSIRLAVRLSVGLAVLGLAACADQPAAPRQLESPSGAALSSTTAPSGNAVVVFSSERGIPSGGAELVTSVGGTITTRLDRIGVVYASGLSASALQTLRASGLVEDAGPDYELNWLPGVYVGGVVSIRDDASATSHRDPTVASRFKVWQWGPQRINAPAAWKAGHLGSSSIRVAILDTGIDAGHRELRGLVDLTRSASFVSTEKDDTRDYHFHGTHVASTVSTNALTIAGVSLHNTLMAVKVLSRAGRGSFEGVTAGIVFAADKDAHVINMSLGAQFDRNLEGGPALLKALRRAIDYAGEQGTLVVSAAGNSETNLDNSGNLVAVPCEYSHLCVSATGPLNGQFNANGPVLTAAHDQPSWFTNYGRTAVHVAAPGGNYNPADPDQAQGTWRDTDLVVGACSRYSSLTCQTNQFQEVVNFYAFAAGTSMASPHVAGAAGLVQAAAGGSLTPAQLIDRLTRFADDVGEPGNDIYSNRGRINVFRAITQQ